MILFLLFSLFGTSTSAGRQQSELRRLAWLQGCWLAESPRRVVEETWSAPRGNSMIGTSRTLRADSLVEYELIVLREVDGALEYHAHPSGQPAAKFREQEVTDSSVVFANPSHDFPQRIGYRRVRSDSLLAWIEGARGGATRRVRFGYARTACAAPR